MTRSSEDTLELYSLGRLTEPELARVEEHLLMCPHCQDRVSWLDSYHAALKEALGAAQVDNMPEDLMSQVEFHEGFLTPAGLEPADAKAQQLSDALTRRTLLVHRNIAGKSLVLTAMATDCVLAERMSVTLTVRNSIASASKTYPTINFESRPMRLVMPDGDA